MIRNVEITRYQSAAAPESGVADDLHATPRTDVVALEEPLEICVEGHPLAVAMRTPGQDRELVAGWLLAEGIIRHAGDLADLVAAPGAPVDSLAPEAASSGLARVARVDVFLREPSGFDPARHRRSVLTNASCGLCGAASVEQVLRDFPKIDSRLSLDPVLLALLPQLPARVLAAQPVFQRTGGLHACALFDPQGQLLALREDIGRHNALDKLLGWALLENRLPLARTLLFLSGRVSFEMVQKALAAGLPLIVALGAPSSLAIDLARAAGQDLVAFLRGSAFNLYT